MHMIKFKNNFWNITGGGLNISISKKEGVIQSLKREGFLWSSFAGTVQIKDDLKKRIYNETDIKKIDVKRKHDYLEITKWLNGADFVLKEKYKPENGHILWSAKVELIRGQQRSIAIEFIMPLPQKLWEWQAWSGNGHLPDYLYKFGNLTLDYHDVYGTMIPAVSIYNENNDVGLVICKPFGQRVPALRFSCDYPRSLLTTEFYWMRLDKKTSSEVSLMLRGQGGCYRETLGWLFNKYPDYFLPHYEDINELEGGHMSGDYHTTENKCKIMSQLGMKWYELHHHFPYLGQYHPTETSWLSEASRTHPDEPELWKKKCSPELIRKTISSLKKYGIAAMMYIQLAGDGDYEMMTKYFPGSIAFDAAGDTYPAWIGCIKMNGDPSLPFGKDIIKRQIDGIIERYPQMGGFFVDMYGCDAVDFAHDDGSTMVNNKAAYRLVNAYYKNGKYIFEQARKHNLALVTSGCNNIELTRYSDIIMAEHLDWTYLQTQWQTIAKPMVFLNYDLEPESIEQMFQKCLIYGAMFTSRWETKKSAYYLYERYLPLIDKLIGRRWVFYPRAIKLPLSLKGNIFINGKGLHIVTLVRDYCPSSTENLSKQEVVLNIPENIEIKSMILTRACSDKISRLSFSRKKTMVTFKVPADLVAGVVEIESTTRKRVVCD